MGRAQTWSGEGPDLDLGGPEPGVGSGEGLNPEWGGLRP